MAGLSVASIHQITVHMLAAGGSPPPSPSPSASSAKRDWLGVVTAVAAVFSAFAALWFPLIAGPRYRLRWGPVKLHKLDDGSWRVRIYLSGRGRRDITKEAFEEGKPVAVDFGVPIRELTECVSSQHALRIVKHEKKGTRLLVGPGLIGRRQDLRFTLTTVAKPTHKICQAALIDVPVRRQFLTPAQRVVGITLLALFAYDVAWWVALDLLDRHTQMIYQHPVATLVALLIGNVVITIGIGLRNRNPLA